MTLHTILPPTKDMMPCIYPAGMGTRAWCTTHCADHQGHTEDQFDTQYCADAGCIHDPHNAESPLALHSHCDVCQSRSACWDSAWDPADEIKVCWSCMDRNGQYTPLFRPDERSDDD